MSESARRWLSLLALALGVAGVAYLVHETGPERVWQTIVLGAWTLPLVMLGDAGYFACEALAHRSVLGSGAAAIPGRVFVRSTALVYVVGALLPLGRAGAEVARAATFAPYVGAGRSTAAGTNVQVAAFVGNTFISSVCLVACLVALGAHWLTGLLAVNGSVTFVLAVVAWALLRHDRLGSAIAKRWPGLAARFEGLGEGLRASRGELLRAIGFACLARVVQVGMYAALLVAVGITPSLLGALLALAVHLVGAGFGDLVPNQVGVLEGAYRVFADALSLGDDPARAVSIALFARVSQIGIASISMIGLGLTRGSKPAAA
ncbi:MAG: lysylphosphatidylglycerol synthase domain-containing protein [Sandaracinus sp.]